MLMNNIIGFLLDYLLFLEVWWFYEKIIDEKYFLVNSLNSDSMIFWFYFCIDSI